MDETTPPNAGGDLPLPQAPLEASGSRGLRHLAGLILRRSGTREVETGPVDALDEIDRLIPPMIDDFHPDDGYRYQRPRELDVATVRGAVRRTFDLLDGGAESQALQEASSSLFAKLVPHHSRDTTDLAKLDRLLTNYPQNVIDGLGEQASADGVLTTIQVGDKLLDVVSRQSSDIATGYFMGLVAQLMSAKIPQFVALEGADSVTELEEVAAAHSLFAVENYIDFRLRYRNGLPSLPYRPEDTVGHAAPESPFTHEDADSAWS